jgi:SAM-dependent methyltransferase
VDTTGSGDVWTHGEGYESYVGRWSRQVARAFLSWLDLPPGGRWLDIGCGTGSLSEVIVEAVAPAEVVGIDPSPDYVAYARERVLDPRVRFEIGDADALPVLSARFDAVVAGLVLNFVPNPATAVAEMARAVRPGGMVSAYVWDYAEGMELMRRFWDAAVALDPAARELDEGKRFGAVCRPDVLAALFHDAGLRGIAARAIDVPTVFRDFDDYWSPFLSGQGPAPGYAMSLSEEDRVAVRERLRGDLPAAADGTIPLSARAWAVRGER